uniref:Uncharacterized protein n=1 Tax=Pseudomonas fluorescens (strain SBW25) TaxID=216595 RepID=A0A0G4E4M8_PSEFS|nr:hypothetical protein PQBR57_0238 [Pseudomonas fluorescens SBW25]
MSAAHLDIGWKLLEPGPGNSSTGICREKYGTAVGCDAA